MFRFLLLILQHSKIQRERIVLHIRKAILKRNFLTKNIIYKDYIAEFALECIIKNKISLQKYLPSIFDTIYIDEAQDLCGYDFEILKFLLQKTNVPIIVAGDAKQTTYTTANVRKNKKFTFDSYLAEKVNRPNKEYIIIDQKNAHLYSSLY